MIRWKDSVRFTDLHPAIVFVAMRANEIYSTFGIDCWITSLNDSTHKTNSKHYSGRAVDLRTHDLPDEAARVNVASQLKSALGPQFTVLYESAGTPNAHIHCQLNDPAPPAPAGGQPPQSHMA